jgi:hypothetical protein
MTSYDSRRPPRSGGGESEDGTQRPPRTVPTGDAARSAARPCAGRHPARASTQAAGSPIRLGEGWESPDATFRSSARKRKKLRPLNKDLVYAGIMKFTGKSRGACRAVGVEDFC